MWNCVASCPCVGGLRILSQDLSSGTSMNLRSSFHLFAIIILSSGLAKLRTFASPSHNGAKFLLMKLHQNFYSPKVLGDSNFLNFFIRSPEFDKKTFPLITDFLLAFSITVDCHHWKSIFYVKNNCLSDFFNCEASWF